MAVLFSSIVAAQERGSSRSSFSAQALDLAPLGDLKSSVLVCDDFRVSGRPFPLHPHAGFVAATYVFPDSAGRLRSRDSLGNDIVVGAGGLVWTHAGSGIVHHETPADTGELHGLQLFVNLTSQRSARVDECRRRSRPCGGRMLRASDVADGAHRAVHASRRGAPTTSYVRSSAGSRDTHLCRNWRSCRQQRRWRAAFGPAAGDCHAWRWCALKLCS